jgi:hypothetical protein
VTRPTHSTKPISENVVAAILRLRRSERKPSVARLIARAKEAGATSVTLPDGTRIDLGEPTTSDGNNPWLAAIDKATKQ